MPIYPYPLRGPPSSFEGSQVSLYIFALRKLGELRDLLLLLTGCLSLKCFPICAFAPFFLLQIPLPYAPSLLLQSGDVPPCADVSPAPRQGDVPPHADVYHPLLDDVRPLLRGGVPPLVSVSPQPALPFAPAASVIQQLPQLPGSARRCLLR